MNRPSSLPTRTNTRITIKTGSTLRAMAMDSHFIASPVLAVHSKDISIITAKVTRKGLTTLDMSFANLIFISIGGLRS
jgi:hypothetical protein